MMGGLLAGLLSLAGPVIIRMLIALGIGTLTFTGVTTALQDLIGAAVSSWASVPSAILALASIAGIPQALGIVAGAYTTRVGIWVAASATKWVTK
jgi:hypothetical protein